MKYRLNTTNYHTFDIFEVNKLPARSYFIPYPDRAGTDAVTPKQKRYASPQVIMWYLSSAGDKTSLSSI